MKQYITLLFLFAFTSSIAQDIFYKDNQDHIYKKYIKTVEFKLENNPLSYPIIPLDSGVKLNLSFDDMEGDFKDYYYTIVHCNADWTPSDLTKLDYIDGFEEGDITEYDYSFNTLTDFTNYTLSLPNDDMRFILSGNYVLQVFLEEDEREPVLTRRFVVTETLLTTRAEIRRASKVTKLGEAHEIDFVVDDPSNRFRRYSNTIQANIIQNGRWDNAIIGLKPLFVRDKMYDFDYTDKIVFEAGKEFRFIDIRKLNRGIPRIIQLEDSQEGYDVYIDTDECREYDLHFFQYDINGGFIIANRIDVDLSTTSSMIDARARQGRSTNFNELFADSIRIESYRQAVYEAARNKEGDILESDYANVHFSLKSVMPFREEEVYLFGKMTDWKLDKQFKMKYNAETGVYQLVVPLKQGYYNYQYIVHNTKNKKISLDTTEGNNEDTENDYTILVYYRPFGQSYDSIISYETINSVFNR